MSKHNYFVKFLIKINKFINSLLSRNLNKLIAANLKNILINNTFNQINKNIIDWIANEK